MAGLTPPYEWQVADFLGRTGDVAIHDLAVTHLPIVTAAVFAYTRGKGFTNGVPDMPLEAVIVSSCSRSVTNPQQDRQVTSGPFSVSPGTFAGWSLPELAILNGYRVRAQ